MATYTNRERFIPFAKAELIEMLCAHAALEPADGAKFRAMCKILESIFHFKFHTKVESLKAHYAPFDPDKDTRAWKKSTATEIAAHESAFVTELRALLDNANFSELPKEELAFALREESLFNVSLFVDFDDFAEHVIFTRGSVVNRATIKKLVFWKEEIDVPTFERVTLLVKFKPQEYFTEEKRKKLTFEPGSMLLKLFKNVPKADLEMLFPNTQVRMKLRDKLILGVPGVVGGIAVLAKAGASIVATFLILWLLVESRIKGVPPVYPQSHKMALVVAALTSLLGLGGYLFRQYSAYKNRKLAFMKAHSDNLYFRNLDNNAGVFYRITDAAEEEECKEAILSYFFLFIGKKALAPGEIDDAVEAWFEREHKVLVDFEIADALRKLSELGLCEEKKHTAESSPLYRAVPLDESCRRLDALWDNFFAYNS